MISNIPYIKNSDLKLGNASEITSAISLLRYYGFKITEKEFKRHLSIGEKIILKNGKYIGGNPEEQFVGNPEHLKEDGTYGSFEKPILKVLNSKSKKFKDVSNSTEDDFIKNIDSNIPTLVWTSTEENKIEDGITWETNSGSFTEKIGKNVVMLIGYNENYFIVNDPKGKENYKINRKDFMNNYSKLGSRAIAYLE